MDKNKILESLEASLSKLLGGEGELYQASYYAVFPAGKRLRPLLALAVASDLGKDPYSFLNAACALELLHNSSLIHDDLPCMDNDDFRRGRPTVHRKFSEATALLAGDFLIARSFDAIFSCEPLSLEQKAILSQSLATAYRSLCEGQELDLQLEKDIEKITKIHALKTGALYQSCFEFGAVFSGLSDEYRELTAKTGLVFGILFQILDDYLDIYGDPDARGRPKGSDEKNQKETFFTLHSGDDAVTKLKQLKSDFESMLSELEVKLEKRLSSVRGLLEPIVAQLKM